MRKRFKRYSYKNSHKTITESSLFSLTPFTTMHVNPGETIRGHVGQFIRFLPLKAPLLNRFFLHHWWFYVPYRLLDRANKDKGWTDTAWMDYSRDQMLGRATADKSLPTCKGLPFLFQAKDEDVSAYPLRAYNLIFNTFFNDDQIQEPVDLDENWSKSDTFYNFGRGFVSFFKQYETTMLVDSLSDKQFTAKYDSSGTIELTTTKAVTTKTLVDSTTNAGVAHIRDLQLDTDNIALTEDLIHSANEKTVTIPSREAAVDLDDLKGSFTIPVGTKTTYTSAEDGILHINEADFRDSFKANRIQMEAEIYGEKDYRDALQSIGGRISRQKVDQPELLMHSHRLLPMNDTMSQEADTLGEVGGYMLGTKRDRFPSRQFKEHGLVIGLMAIRPEMYFNGVAESRESTLDMHWNPVPFWFGTTPCTTYNPSFRQAKYDGVTKALTSTTAHVDKVFGFALDQGRKQQDKFNTDVMTKGRINDSTTKKYEKYGPWRDFFLMVENINDRFDLRAPYNLVNDLNALFVQSPLASTGSQAPHPWVKAGSHCLIKSDLKLTKLSPIQPITKSIISSKIG